MSKKVAKKVNSIPVVPAGTPWAELNGSIFVSKMIQHILAFTDKPARTYDFDGTLIKTLDEMSDKISDLGGNLVMQKDDEVICFLWEDGSYAILSFSEETKDICLSGVSVDDDLLDALEKVADEYISQAKNNLVFSIVKVGDNLQLRNMGVGSSPLVPENYTEKELEDYHYIIEGFKKTPPIGRIAILSGIPGTGKTHLIRSMLSELDCVFLIVPSNLLEVLDKPEFLPLLLDTHEDYNKPIVMVIEDGDLCLVPRESDNISSIASLLNLSDGILGTIMDVKMIISTNAAIKDIDDAITRPGRLCKKVEIGPRTHEHANKIYQRLTGDPTATLRERREYTLAEIYEFFNTKDIVKTATHPTRRPIGFSTAPVEKAS